MKYEPKSFIKFLNMGHYDEQYEHDEKIQQQNKVRNTKKNFEEAINKLKHEDRIFLLEIMRNIYDYKIILKFLNK